MRVSFLSLADAIEAETGARSRRCGLRPDVHGVMTTVAQHLHVANASVLLEPRAVREVLHVDQAFPALVGLGEPILGRLDMDDAADRPRRLAGGDGHGPAAGGLVVVVFVAALSVNIYANR